LENPVSETDVVLVVDRQTDHQKVLYGRSTLELISTGLHPDVTVKAKALRLPVDFDSDDVEQVGAVCLDQKRHAEE